MSIISQERPSDSPLIASVIRGETVRDGSSVRPAESHWHLVFVNHQGRTRTLVVGPWTTAGVARWQAGAEVTWIKFEAGTFMPKLPFRALVDKETPLEGATSWSFWLNGSAWQVPDADDVEAFVGKLVRDGAIMNDPVVKAVLQSQPQTSSQALSPRTLRHRFLQATGLSQNDIRQIRRAQHTEALLRRGVPVADAVYQAGYFDQPHLTRSLKQWVGHTPAQIIRSSTL